MDKQECLQNNDILQCFEFIISFIQNIIKLAHTFIQESETKTIHYTVSSKDRQLVIPFVQPGKCMKTLYFCGERVWIPLTSESVWNPASSAAMNLEYT